MLHNMVRICKITSAIYLVQYGAYLQYNICNMPGTKWCVSAIQHLQYTWYNMVRICNITSVIYLVQYGAYLKYNICNIPGTIWYVSVSGYIL